MYLLIYTQLMYLRSASTSPRSLVTSCTQHPASPGSTMRSWLLFKIRF